MRKWCSPRFCNHTLMSTESSDYNSACNIQQRRRSWNRETEKFGVIRWGWREHAKQSVEIKLRNWNSSTKPNNISEWFSPALKRASLPARMDWQQNVFTGLERMHLELDWVTDCSQWRGNSPKWPSLSWKQRNSSLKVFVDSQHLSSQAWKGRLTNKLSLCFHSDLWMACASACDSQMPGKTRLAHKKPALCRKPVITAIIQLDLICIIKLCYCLALGDCKSHRLYDGGQGGT